MIWVIILHPTSQMHEYIRSIQLLHNDLAFDVSCYFGSTFCIIHSSAQEYDVNKRTSFHGWVSRTRYVSLSKSFSKHSGAIYEIEVEFNCQNIFRYNDRKLRSDIGSMFNDSLCFADCCRTGCVLTAMHVERKQSLFDSWQLTPAQENADIFFPNMMKNSD